MRSLFILAFLTVLFPGCGTLETVTQYNGPIYIDQELRPVVRQWIKDCRQHLESWRCNTDGIERIVRVEKFKEDFILGICDVRWRGVEQVRRIYIHKNIRVDGYYMRAVMLHEMMHCRMGFETHSQEGIMAPSMMYGEEALKNKWPELLKETYSLVK